MGIDEMSYGEKWELVKLISQAEKWELMKFLRD